MVYFHYFPVLFIFSYIFLVCMLSVFVFKQSAAQNFLLSWRKKIDAKAMLRYGYLIGLGVWMAANVVLYAVIINSTSTKGYFLGQAERKTNQQEFRYNIVRFTMVSQQRELRANMQTTSDVKKILMPKPPTE